MIQYGRPYCIIYGVRVWLRETTPALSLQATSTHISSLHEHVVARKILKSLKHWSGHGLSNRTGSAGPVGYILPCSQSSYRSTSKLPNMSTHPYFPATPRSIWSLDIINLCHVTKFTRRGHEDGKCLQYPKYSATKMPIRVSE